MSPATPKSSAKQKLGTTRQNVWRHTGVAITAALLSLFVENVTAQTGSQTTSDVGALKKLAFEEFFDLEITTVSGRPERLVEDNGIGIEPVHHKRVFQIFGQVHPEKKYGGTGIGLAVVRKAAQRMSGEVEVESEANQGSRFWSLLNEEKHDNDESRVTPGRG